MDDRPQDGTAVEPERHGQEASAEQEVGRLSDSDVEADPVNASGDQVHHGGPDPDTPTPAELEYRFDSPDVAIAVALVDEALSATMDGWSAASALVEAAVAGGVPGDAPLVRELALACCYPLRMAPIGKAGCSLGPPYGPDAQWPPPATEAVLELWRQVAAAVSSPAAVARFEDLLFEAGDGNGRDRARRAVGCYLQLAETRFDHDGLEALLRAWELARRLGLADLDAAARGIMATQVTGLLSEAPGTLPGVVFPMMAALAAGPLGSKGARQVSDPIDIDTMLRSAAAVYRRGYLASEIAALRRSRTNDPTTIDLINRDEVEAYLDEAHSAPGVGARQVFLEQAATIARNRGLTDLVRRTTAELERIKPSELGLQVVRVEGEMPRHVLEGWLSNFVRSPDWRDSLEVFLSTPPPTGELSDLHASERSTRGGLRRLFASTLLSSQGLPHATTGGDDDQVQYELAVAARLKAENLGRWLAEALNRIAERYGVPTEDDLTLFLSRNGTCDERVARNVAKAFRHFWNGDFESCVHLAVPKVESAAQSLLRELDEGVYQVQKGQHPGGYPGLHRLLVELERIALDESWVFFLRWLLLGPYGANIRNEVAHGFLHTVPPSYAALTLRAVTLLTTVAGQDLSQDSDRRQRETITALLRDPTGDEAAGAIPRTLRHASRGLERAWWHIEAIRSRFQGRARRRSPDSRRRTRA